MESGKRGIVAEMPALSCVSKMEFSEDNIRELGSTGMGWLSPEGDLIPCKFHHHIEVLIDRLSGIDSEIETIREVEYALEHWNEDTPDEHPEWHIFEMYYEPKREEATYTIMRKAYDEGWIRLGIWSGELEAEGSKFNHQTKRDLKDLALMLNLNLRIQERNGS